MAVLNALRVFRDPSGAVLFEGEVPATMTGMLPAEFVSNEALMAELTPEQKKLALDFSYWYAARKMKLANGAK